MQALNAFIINYLIGDWASIIGLLVSFLGFTITIINVIKSRSAAARAESAAMSAVRSVRGIETVEMLTNAISLLEEILRLNRVKEWPVILDRHVAFRKMIIALKSNDVVGGEDYRVVLQSTIQHSSSMSNKIEIALENGEENFSDAAKMNKILSDQHKKLGEMLGEIRKNIGASNV